MAALLFAGCFLVYCHSVWGVLVLVVAAYVVPMVVQRVHTHLEVAERRRAARADEQHQ